MLKKEFSKCNPQIYNNEIQLFKDYSDNTSFTSEYYNNLLLLNKKFSKIKNMDIEFKENI